MKKLILLALTCVASVASYAADNANYDALYEQISFDMPKVTAPVFPNYQVNIKDFGAVGDGSSLCTEAFARAIDHLSAKGGGKLVVPQGVWFTGPIVLKSNINLHLLKGAVILFSPDPDLYPLIDTSFEGLDTRRCQSPISGRNLTNVAITGKGAIDGNGGFWRPVKKGKVTENQWKEFTSRGGAFKNPSYWFPSEGALKGDKVADMNVPKGLKSEAEWNEIKLFLRPVMVSLVSCKNVWLNGVIFQNSPSWNLHPLMCENVLIEDVLVRNPSFAQNGDGLDLESCKNALIVNSTFDVGDDGICIKSGKDADGRKRGVPCENVIVHGCTVFKGHGGFVVGSEMSGGVRNIHVAQCQFLGTDVGLRFKSARGRGGVVENIFIKDISMFDIQTDAITFDLYYGGKSAVESLADGDDKKNSKVDIKPVDETTPCFRNIDIEHVICRGARRAAYFNGLPEMPVENIVINDLEVNNAEEGIVINRTRNVKLDNIHVSAKSKDVVALNSEGLVINGKKINTGK
ncbi:MAG: glycoside hydrolase family 28 protein [Prevotella sp.]|nr:glycoside hydrolase family 28 protein [Prevotella sp.]MDD6978517.1 glycoside hydrolase family 28 protein [Prevotellaceae bacterium]MDD7096850.1 glycoside hydrolase family 28 protein [Prevotellaceae bacterium]MDY5005913.1 glycoside hydrolase family 28 protein [Prevotella sp.]MDY5249945.1 glycoside hydrolase family 28 protein [Prevotella sp.]